MLYVAVIKGHNAALTMVCFVVWQCWPGGFLLISRSAELLFAAAGAGFKNNLGLAGSGLGIAAVMYIADQLAVYQSDNTLAHNVDIAAGVGYHNNRNAFIV